MGSPITGMSTPASSGPTNAPSWKTVKLSVFAAGSSAGSTSRGITALRVGWLIASSADCTANSTSTSQTLPDAARRDHPQRERHHRDARAGDEQQRAAVDRVGDRAAPQPEHDQRDQPEEPGQADVGRRAGEREDLRGHRDDRELRPDHRDDPGRPQPPVGRACAAGGCRRARRGPRAVNLRRRVVGSGSVTLSTLTTAVRRLAW